MKIQAGDYMVWYNNQPKQALPSIGIFRPRLEMQTLFELHFANGDSQLNMPIINAVHFYQLALVSGKVADLDITLVDRSKTIYPILRKYEAYQFSNAQLFDPAR